MADTQRILVVKLGALGNIVLSFGPFATIRHHHAGAHITLLTTAPYAAWMRAAPFFDAVWVDERPEWWDLPGWLRLRRRLVDGRFDRAYDLQTSSRSSRYFLMLPWRRRPEWSGIARGCALPDRDPDRDRRYDVDRQFGQLRQAGIATQVPADFSWMQGEIARFGLPADFALLAPGSSPHRLAKRWPVERYGELAGTLAARGLTPVVVGGPTERPLAAAIRAAVPVAIDLTGQTSFDDLASLGRTARLAAGNDTGPMHLIAAVGCPSIVLFSHDSDPALCAPSGRCVEILRRPDLRDLDLAAVLTVAERLLQPAPVAG